MAVTSITAWKLAGSTVLKTEFVTDFPPSTAARGILAKSQGC